MSRAVAIALTMVALGLAGCKPGTNSSATKGVVKNGLYVDASDVPICPVTGDRIAQGEEVGKTVFKGVEYHFCCPGCPEQFKADPVKYAAK